MYKLKRLHIENVSSHIETDYQIEQNKSVCIFGVNKDTEKERSNGSGKSGLIEGIYLLFMGTSIRNVNKSEIINNNSDFLFVEGELENEVLNTNLLIRRKIHRRKSSEFEIYLNDELCGGIVSWEESKNFVFDLIGISKEDFQNYFIVTKERYQSFFNAGDSYKKQVINRFSGSDRIDTCLDLVKADIEIKNKEKTGFERDIISAEVKLEVYKSNLEEAKLVDPKDEKNNAINELTVKIVNIKEEIDSCTSSQLDHNKEMVELDKKIGEISYEEDEETLKTLHETETDITNKISKLKRDISNIYSDSPEAKKISSIELEKSKTSAEKFKLEYTDLKEVKSLISNIEVTLKGTVTCPKCGHEFSTDEDIDVEEYKLNLKECYTICEQVKSDIQSVADKIVQYDVKISELKTDLEKSKGKIDILVQNTNKEWAGIKSQINKTEELINQKKNRLRELNKSKHSVELGIDTNSNLFESLKIDLQKAEEKLEELKNEKSEKVDLTPYKNKIKETEILIKGIKRSINKVIAEISLLDEVQLNFKKFKSHLANKSIKAIEGLTNLYLRQMKSDLQVKLDGYKLLADGKTIKENIDTQVLRDGMLEGVYNKFSGGERATLDLALIIALQEIINGSLNGKGLEFLATDEVIESIDGVGVEDIVSAMNNINLTSLHVTHAPFSKNVENSLLIVKENGVSQIQQ